MFVRIHSSLVAVLIAALAIGQELVVPANQYFASTGTTTEAWRSTLFRFQMVYDASIFTDAGVTSPIRITRLRFRGADGEANAGGQVWSGTTVKMSTCPLDHSVISALFASNQGADVVTAYSGSVTALPSSGTVPNNSFIDLLLTTPFVYDPGLGDLNIDVDAPSAPAPNADSLIPTAAGSSLLTHKGHCVSTATAGATGGLLSTLAAVVLFDFVGLGGYASAQGARVVSYGAGCPQATASFYEAFGADGFDMSGRSLVLTRVGADDYAVSAGAVAIAPVVSTTPDINDDGVTTAFLPFTFTYPGNPAGTTVISACTNGYVWLGNSTLADFLPTTAKMLDSSVARLAPLWHDFHAGRNTVSHPGSGMYIDIDPTSAVITWKEVGEFNQVGATGGHSVSTFQCVLHASGRVEFRYGAMAGSAGGLRITGFGRGLVAAVASTDPGQRDLSREIPFLANGPDVVGAVPLLLGVDLRPIIGTTITFSTSNIPVTALATANVLGFIPISPGLDLGSFGAPGCLQSVLLGPSAAVLLGPGPTATNTFTIPNQAIYIGNQAYSQSAVLDPTLNAFGVITSNALRLTIGLP